MIEQGAQGGDGNTHTSSFTGHKLPSCDIFLCCCNAISDAPLRQLENSFFATEWAGAMGVDAVALAAAGGYYIAMVRIRNLGQLRCFTLFWLSSWFGRHLIALLFLVVVVSRLTTPLFRQWLTIHPVLWRGCDCLVALATSMRLRRFTSSNNPPLARSSGGSCST